MNIDEEINKALRLLYEREALISATGFDTFDQALEFIKESREIANWAEKPCKPMTNEEHLRMLTLLKEAAERRIIEEQGGTPCP